MSSSGGGFGTAASVRGTTTNDNAAAGFIGEYIVAQLASGAATALVTATSKTVTSIALTAGDWDVDGIVDFVMAAATVTNFKAGSNTVTNTLGGQDTFASDASNFVTDTDTACVDFLTTRYSLAAPTTVYLIAQATFSVGGVTAYGTIRARRVR